MIGSSLIRGSVVAAALVASAGAARATIIPLTIYENTDGVSVAGLNLSVMLSQVGSQVRFEFRNGTPGNASSSIPSTITAIYIENPIFASGSLTNPVIVTESAGVNFSFGGSPNSPAGSIDNFDTPWRGSLSWATRDGSIANGIDPGQFLVIGLDLSGGLTFADVVNAMSDRRQMRVAEHIQRVGTDGASSVWGVNVPTPSSLAILGLAGLAAGRRRR